MYSRIQIIMMQLQELVEKSILDLNLEEFQLLVIQDQDQKIQYHQVQISLEKPEKEHYQF